MPKYRAEVYNPSLNDSRWQVSADITRRLAINENWTHAVRNGAFHLFNDLRHGKHIDALLTCHTELIIPTHEDTEPPEDHLTPIYAVITKARELQPELAIGVVTDIPEDFVELPELSDNLSGPIFFDPEDYDASSKALDAFLGKIASSHQA